MNNTHYQYTHKNPMNFINPKNETFVIQKEDTWQIISSDPKKMTHHLLVNHFQYDEGGVLHKNEITISDGSLQKLKDKSKTMAPKKTEVFSEYISQNSFNKTLAIAQRHIFEYAAMLNDKILFSNYHNVAKDIETILSHHSYLFDNMTEDKKNKFLKPDAKMKKSIEFFKQKPTSKYPKKNDKDTSSSELSKYLLTLEHKAKFSFMLSTNHFNEPYTSSISMVADELKNGLEALKIAHYLQEKSFKLKPNQALNLKFINDQLESYWENDKYRHKNPETFLNQLQILKNTVPVPQKSKHKI